MMDKNSRAALERFRRGEPTADDIPRLRHLLAAPRDAARDTKDKK
jgi:hypothetical protein